MKPESAQQVLEELGIYRKSHQGVWAEFGQKVAKSGLMETRYHAMCVKLFFSRMQSDYLPGNKDTLEGAQKAHSFAAEFVAACRTFLENREKGK